jgi:O-antigen/teichoic acid export membrane protein
VLHIAYTFFSRFTEVIFGVLVLVLSARLFGAEGRGYFTACTSVAAIFGTLCSLNIGRGLYADICDSAESVEEYVKSRFSSIVMIASALSLMGIAGYGIAYLQDFKALADVPGVPVVAFSIYVPCLIWAGVANTLFSSLGALQDKNNIALGSKLAFCLALGAVYYLGGLTFNSFCGLFVGFSFVGLIAEASFLKRRYFSRHPPFAPDVIRLAKKSIAWYPDLVGGYLISGAVSAIVAYFLPPREVGIFGVAMQLYAVGFMLIPSVLQFYFIGDIAKLGRREAIRRLYRYVGAYSAYFILAYVCMIAIGDEVVGYVLGAEFVPALSLLKIMAVAGWMSGIIVLFSPLWTAMQYVKFSNLSTVALGCFSLLVLVLLTSRYSLYGAAWGMLLNYSIAFAGNVILLWYTLRRLGVAH